MNNADVLQYLFYFFCVCVFVVSDAQNAIPVKC